MQDNYLDQSPSLLSIGGTVVSSTESCAMGLGFNSCMMQHFSKS